MCKSFQLYSTVVYCHFFHNTCSCSYFIFKTTIRCWKSNPKERNVDEGNVFVIKTNPRMFAFFCFQSTFLVDFSCFKVKGFSFWPKWTFWKDFLCILEKMSDASDWLPYATFYLSFLRKNNFLSKFWKKVFGMAHPQGK